MRQRDHLRLRRGEVAHRLEVDRRALRLHADETQREILRDRLRPAPAARRASHPASASLSAREGSSAARSVAPAPPVEALPLGRPSLKQRRPAANQFRRRGGAERALRPMSISARSAAEGRSRPRSCSRRPSRTSRSVAVLTRMRISGMRSGEGPDRLVEPVERIIEPDADALAIRPVRRPQNHLLDARLLVASEKAIRSSSSARPTAPSRPSASVPRRPGRSASLPPDK